MNLRVVFKKKLEILIVKLELGPIVDYLLLETSDIFVDKTKIKDTFRVIVPGIKESLKLHYMKLLRMNSR
jgi:hypothetical protein